jgi:predicted chitinase
MAYLLNYKNWKRLYETALSIDASDVAGDRFAEILKSNYQVKEQPPGSNKGPEVSKYLHDTGLGPGYPWCMAFVYSMFSDLSSALGISNPLPKTAGVLDHWSKADESLTITIDAARKNPGLVKPGQIFIMSRPGKGTGHTGIVVSVDITNSSFKSIEGNTNDQLSGEGDRVGINKRELSSNSLIGFIDYFKGSRDEKFENTISQTLTNQKTDFSADTKDNIDPPTTTPSSDTPPSSLLDPIRDGQKLLKTGMTGDDVTEIQKKLKEKGFFTKEPNGEFDKDTYNAVKSFQRSASIGVDGIVGPQTYSALFTVPVNQLAIDQAKVERGKIELANGKIKSSYTGEKQNNINLLINEMTRQGITNPYSQVGILAVIGKESNFIPKNENMNYSKERLPEVWGVFSKTGKMVPKGQGQANYNDLAVQYERNPEKLANFVYGQKPNGMRTNAYGNTQPGDGWKYRGRGFNGITFKSGYQKYATATGIDLVNNPDMLNDPATSAKVAVLYFINTIKPHGIDLNSFTSTEDATRVFVRANAGWGSDQTVQSWAYANAAKIIPNFTIEPGAIA